MNERVDAGLGGNDRYLAYGMAPVAVAIAIVFASLAGRFLPHANLSLVFLTAVLIVASRTGLGPGLLTGILSFLVYNYFFIVPQYTFLVNDDGDIATLLFFLLMATVTGNLAAGMQREMAKSEASIARLSNLQAFGEQMLSAVKKDQVLDILAGQLRETTRSPVVLFWPGPGNALVPAGDIQISQPDSNLVVRVWDEPRPGLIEADGWTFLHLGSSRGPLALMATPAILGPEGVSGLVRSLCHQAALALERVLLADDLAEAELVSETEQLRSALLSSVSHDLRTPLASIIGSTSSLLELGDSFSSQNRRELLGTVLSEARRLDRYIQNLLDMTRLGQGNITLRRDWVDIRDLIASATARLRATGEDLPVFDVAVDAKTPMIWVHGVLIEQALVNLLDNAARFSPPDGHVAIEAKQIGEQMEIRVCDQGPGIPAEARAKVFDMFYTVRQGDRAVQQGTGLGLSICRGLVGAHGGAVEATDGHDGKGTCMVIRLPLSLPPMDAAHD